MVYKVSTQINAVVDAQSPSLAFPATSHIALFEPHSNILSCVINGKADLFVTGDEELLELKKIEKISILSPRAFWEKIRKN